MSGGRVPVKGGLAVHRLSWRVGISSLRDYIVDTQPPIKFGDARKLHRLIRDAVKIYRMAHGGRKGRREPLTRTETLQAIMKVQRLAGNVVKSGGSEIWRDRLDDALSQNLHVLANLHSVFKQYGVDTYELRKRLFWQVFDKTDLPHVERFAALDAKSILPERTHPDPPLVQLVVELTPIWKTMTGTSTYPRNNREGGKFSPFSDWVSLLIKEAGLTPPPVNRIPLIVKRQNLRK